MFVKCKHCRTALFDEDVTPVRSNHGEILNGKAVKRICGDETGNPESCLYLSTDDIPDWIRELVDKESWTKGRIHCPSCQCRLGAFDFVAQARCPCGENVPPPIRIIISKVDRFIRL